MLSLLFETTRWSHIPPFLTILQMEGSLQAVTPRVCGLPFVEEAHMCKPTPAHSYTYSNTGSRPGPHTEGSCTTSAEGTLTHLLHVPMHLYSMRSIGQQRSTLRHAPRPTHMDKSTCSSYPALGWLPGSSTGSQSRNQVCWELSAQMSSQETDLRLHPSPGAWPVLRPAARAESRGQEGQMPPCPLPRPGSYSEGVTVGVRTRV